MKRLHNIFNRELLLEKLKNDPTPRTTISFYRYVRIANPTLFRDHLYQILDELGVLGRIYIATEGINGQISVPDESLDSFKISIDQIEYLKNIRLNIAIDDNGKSFFKLKINVRSKIVADGIDDPSFDPSNSGIHLDAKEFNEKSMDPNAVIIDMRNHYESEVGKFKDAICPEVVTFRESLPIIVDMLKDRKDQPVLMYCTGGIRCEKASAYFKHNGFTDVYQLNGGIIQYAKQIKEQNLESRFIGKNFVFDERLGERITEDVIGHCHQCGATCDNHTNCANDQCHILFIQCDACKQKYESCCSSKCKEFNHLSEDEKNKLKGSLKFNGSSFSKGRYKAHSKESTLVLE
ncbi:MAG TPA: rhodanese-related sulfurtransferase [Saprospiraceae bacterium]|nr:rhodanese-related sulfurtransferase [Saprospiraceae bacterium]